MKNNGFGLLELLIIVVIVAILALFAMRGTLSGTNPETPSAQQGESDVQAARNVVNQVNAQSSTEQNRIDGLAR